MTDLNPEDRALIEPCPFCGSDDIEPLHGAMKCRNCGTVGPGDIRDNTKRLAAWNTRAACEEGRCSPGDHVADVGKMVSPPPSGEVREAVAAWLFKKYRAYSSIVDFTQVRPEAQAAWFNDAAAILALLPIRDEAALPEPVATFQERVQPWMMACFGAEIAADRLERNDRFIEEALELVQASGYPAERAHALVEYVYGRPQGDINQEVGGVMITLAAHCLAHGVDMHAAGDTELSRIWTKVEQIRAKQAAKPTGSALPIAAPQAQPATEQEEGR